MPFAGHLTLSYTIVSTGWKRRESERDRAREEGERQRIERELAEREPRALSLSRERE